MPMDNSNVIFEYTDRQAVEDGVLVSVNGPQKVNRVTRAVFDRFTEEMDRNGLATDITVLMTVIRAMADIDPDEDGWRTGKYVDRDLWLVPNEVGGLTLLFPSDY